MSQRLLIAVGDADLAGAAAALASESDELEVVERVSEPEELARALRRLDVDVVALHDALGTVPVMEIAREIAASFPEVGMVLLAADPAPELMRTAMQTGIRDVVSLPLSLEQLESSARAAAQWSRALRERVSGEETAVGALAGNLIAVAGAKGGVGSTTVAIHLALAAARNAPGRPVCLVDFDLQKGDMRAYLDTPYRRSVVDLVEVADEISVRHLQETLFTHREGVRLLLAPDDGERAEEVDSTVARNVLGAVRARHALTVVDLGATVSEASAIGAEMASKVLVVSTPDVVVAARRAPHARPVAAAAGPRRRPGHARAAQPGLAQARGAARPRPQGRRRPARRRRRSRPTSRRSRPPSTPARRRAWRTRSCAAPSRRSPPRSRRCPPSTTRPTPTASRAACWPGSPASAARRASSSPASCRCC